MLAIWCPAVYILFCPDPMFSIYYFFAPGPLKLPGFKIDTFLKDFNGKSMVFRSPAAPDPARRLKSMLF